MLLFFRSAVAATVLVIATACTSDAARDPSGGAPDGPPPAPDACVPTTCADHGAECGAVDDGCGVELSCGDCAAPAVCGGRGTDHVCEAPCEPVGALFFDLGDTLLQPGDGAGFVEVPGAGPLLEALTTRGVRIGVITNTPPGWSEQDLRAALANPEFLDDFEVLLLSSQATSPAKPHPDIFTEAHGMMADAPPIGQTAFVTETLGHLADKAQAPTEGARAAGMLGVHLSSGTPSPLADFTIAPGSLTSLADSAWMSCSTP